MAITNQERVGKAMDLLRAGLAPFVEREAQSAVKAGTLRIDAVRAPPTLPTEDAGGRTT